eukprot:6211780-Pleurochrysis_carterae.AAC.1
MVANHFDLQTSMFEKGRDASRSLVRAREQKKHGPGIVSRFRRIGHSSGRLARYSRDGVLHWSRRQPRRLVTPGVLNGGGHRCTDGGRRGFPRIRFRRSTLPM